MARPNLCGELHGRPVTAQIEALCQEFEAAWKRRQQPVIRDYLSSAGMATDPQQQRESLAQLILLDQWYRWQSRPVAEPGPTGPDEETLAFDDLGPRPLLAEYATRYPLLGPLKQWPLELIVQEYQVRHRWGDRPGWKEYLRRYSDRGPELTRRLDEVDSSLQQEAVARRTRAAPPAVAEATSPTLTVQELAQRIERSGVLSEEELTAFQASFGVKDQLEDAEALADALVRAGQLTDYQANRIRQGRIRGLTIGHYSLLEPLGAGAMGRVFKARHRSMGRLVAFKLLSARLLNSPEGVQRFRREVRAAAKLSHPNIVTAHDAGEYQGLQYLVMEYVDGPDLGRLVAQQGPLPIARALNYIIQAARALEYAHSEGVVHRDVKPTNLLVDHKGQIKILDLGLARLDDPTSALSGLDRLTASGHTMGTLNYMAPEQAEDPHQADHRADIYSLGCTLHHLLTGHSPFRATVSLQMARDRAEEPVPSLCAARPDVPPLLEEVFQKMVAPRPADRYESMRDVLTALRAVTVALCATEDDRS